MAHIDQLENYFASTGRSGGRIGSEVETFFVCDDGNAITREQSQSVFERLASDYDWKIASERGEMITSVWKGGNRILYELGYPNFELAVSPLERSEIVGHTRALLDDLYRAAESEGAYPNFSPLYHGNGKYLAIPDERDATWLRLDGKEALSPLACISAVQYTVDVDYASAVDKLDSLWMRSTDFLKSYPQDKVWKQYIAASKAGYLPDRYGGDHSPIDTMYRYCANLAKHDVVQGETLVPFGQARLDSNDAIALHIRSVWWYFRLRRYSERLCIEVRPLPRRRDDLLQEQLEFVLEAMEG